MLNLEVRHLRLVEAVAEEGTVTRAGKRLHLTQSALSHQLRDLEERMGTPLFLRLKKRMALTPAGECLLASSRRVLEDLRRAEEEIRGLNGGQHGTLRLSTECYTCYHWLPPLLKQFHRRFPQVDVQIDVNATRRPVAALLDGRLDLAIISDPAPTDRRLEVQPLFEDELVAVVARTHPLASKHFLRARDFEQETFICYSSAEDSTVMQKFLLPAGVQPKNLQRVVLTEAILEMVKAGLGIAVLARWAVAPYARSGAVKAIPLAQHALRRQWSAVTLKQRSTPEYMKEFVRLLTEDALPARGPSVAKPALARAAAGD